MRKSEIFESFIKIAQDKGLISKDAPEKAIKELSKNHRMDSLSIKDIEKLYNVKPDAPKDMEYKRNIIEDAHPTSLVISPSYDKLNGLIENNNERQNIILNILDKIPNGQLTNHKYAKDNLTLNLVRLANDLDNKNKEQLMELADACLAQLTNRSLNKTAVPILAIGLIAGVASTLGALYAQQHMNFSNEGFQKNHQKLVEELDDLITSNSDWGVGVKYKPEFIQSMQEFKSKLTELNNTISKYLPIIDQLETPHTAKELIELSKKPETNTVVQAYKALRANYFNVIPYIKSVLDNFGSQNYKDRQVVEKGVLTSLVDKTQVLHGGKGLVADDFDDVRRALGPYKTSLIEIMNILKKSGSIEQQAAQELKDAASEAQSDVGVDNTTEPTPNSPSPNRESPEMEQEVAKLTQDLPTSPS